MERRVDANWIFPNWAECCLHSSGVKIDCLCQPWPRFVDHCSPLVFHPVYLSAFFQCCVILAWEVKDEKTARLVSRRTNPNAWRSSWSVLWVPYGNGPQWLRQVLSFYPIFSVFYNLRESRQYQFNDNAVLTKWLAFFSTKKKNLFYWLNEVSVEERQNVLMYSW